MARHLRIVGITMMGLGALLFATYIIEPLNLVWGWFREMPVPLQIGVAVAAVGLTILMISLVVEKRRDSRNEGDLSAE
jgi:hypothetical protein